MAAAGAVVAGAAGLMALGTGTASADTVFDDVGPGADTGTSSVGSPAPYESPALSFVSGGSESDFGIGTGSAGSDPSASSLSSSPVFASDPNSAGSSDFESSDPDLGSGSGSENLVADVSGSGSDPSQNVNALASPSLDSDDLSRTDPQPMIEPASVFDREPLSTVAQSAVTENDAVGSTEPTSFTDPAPLPTPVPWTGTNAGDVRSPSIPVQLSTDTALGSVDNPIFDPPSNLVERPTLPALDHVTPPTVLANGTGTDPHDAGLDGGTIGVTDRETDRLDTLLGLPDDPDAPTSASGTMLDVGLDPTDRDVTFGWTDPETTKALDRALLGNGDSSLFAPGQTWSNAAESLGPLTPTAAGPPEGPDLEYGFLDEQDSDAIDRLFLPPTGGSADGSPLFDVADPDTIAWVDESTNDNVRTEPAQQQPITTGGMYRPSVPTPGPGTGRNDARFEASDILGAIPGAGLLDPGTAGTSGDIWSDQLGSAALGAGGEFRLPQLTTSNLPARPSGLRADGTAGTPAPGQTPTGSDATGAGTTQDADSARRFQEALGYSTVGVPFALGVGTAFRLLDPTLNNSLSKAFQAAATRAPTGFAQDLTMLGGAGGVPISGDRDLDRFLHSQVVDTAIVTAADMGLRRVNPVINNYGAANPNMRGSSWLRNARLDSGLPWWALATIGPTLGAANYTIDTLETDVFGFGVDKNGRPVPQNNAQYYADRAARDLTLGATIGTVANVSLRNRQLPQQAFDRAVAVPGQINNAVRRLTGQPLTAVAPTTPVRATTPAAVTSVPRWASVAGLLAPFVLPPIQQFVTNRVINRPPQRDALDDVIDGVDARVVQPLSNVFGSDTVRQTGGVISDAAVGCVSGMTTRANCVAGAVSGAGLAFRDRTTLGRNATQDVITSDGTVGDAFTDNVGAVVGQAGNVLDTGLNGLSAGLATIAAPLVPLHELLQYGSVRPVSFEERLQILAEEPSIRATNAAATEYVNNIGRIVNNTGTMLTGTAQGGLNLLRTGNWEAPAPTRYSDCAAPGQVQCLTPGTNRLVVGPGAPTRVDNAGRTMTRFSDCTVPGQSQCVTPGTNRLVVGSGTPTRVDNGGRTVPRPPDCNAAFQVQCITPGTNRLTVGTGRDTTTLPDGRTVENVTIESLRQEVESRTPADYERAFQNYDSGRSAGPPSPALVNPVTQMQQQIQNGIGTQVERLGNTYNRAVQDTGNAIQRGSEFVQGWTNDRRNEAGRAWNEAGRAWNDFQQSMPWNRR